MLFLTNVFICYLKISYLDLGTTYNHNLINDINHIIMRRIIIK